MNVNANDLQRCIKRLEKEQEDMKKYDTFQIEVDKTNTCLWKVSFTGADETLYAGEKYTLQFKFSQTFVI